MKTEFLGDAFFQMSIADSMNDKENLSMMAMYNSFYGQMKPQQKYVLRNSILSCTMGTKLSRLDMPSDHGIAPPAALISDSVVDVNVHPFCNCKASRYPCKPVITTGWQQDKSTTKGWNEIKQRYEDVVKENAMLTCLYGGIITVAEIPPKLPFIKPTILLCLYRNKIALVDTLHPQSQTVIDESIVFANIDDEGVALADKPINNKDKDIILYAMGATDESDRSGIAGELESVANEMAGEDNVDRGATAATHVLDKVDEGRSKGLLPEGNELTDLAEQYLAAGGDHAGVLIGSLWAFGLTLNTTQEKAERLKQFGIYNTEKLGEITFDGDGYWWKLLADSFLPLPITYKVDWKNYMQRNPILKGMVGDVVIPIGYILDVGESKEISLQFSMIIENGGGYTAYEFLHGTVDQVGGFQIKGNVSKKKNGDVIYKMEYTWNDVMNPEIARYADDAERAEKANKYLNPKDYIIHIEWSDTTKIIEKPGIFSKSSGWLKDWSSGWIDSLNKKYSYLYGLSDGEQQTPAYGGLGWAQRLEQIKEKHYSYYN